MNQIIYNSQVRIPVGDFAMEGTLQIPETAQSLVLFVHSSDHRRSSEHNRYVAQLFQRDGLATILLDLLSREEEIDLQTRHLRFDVELLASRVLAATNWLMHQPATQRLILGYFGSGTGAAAALMAAATCPLEVRAVVSHGGRPELASSILSAVQAPTLLIMASDHTPVIEMNENGLGALTTTKRLAMIPGATYSFDEPGALEEVARLAGEWFQSYLTTTDGQAKWP